MSVVTAERGMISAPPSRLLTADMERSTVTADQDADGAPFVVVTADPLRLDISSLFAEADSEFGLCCVIRLTGHCPAVGIIRQTEHGFREYWRTAAPSLRPLLRRIQNEVEHARTVPLFWRLRGHKHTFAVFHLGGWNRQHRVWYCRLDAADPANGTFLLAPVDEPGAKPIKPIPYLP